MLILCKKNSLNLTYVHLWIKKFVQGLYPNPLKKGGNGKGDGKREEYERAGMGGRERRKEGKGVRMGRKQRGRQLIQVQNTSQVSGDSPKLRYWRGTTLIRNTVKTLSLK